MVTAELLQEIKENLFVTWNDEDDAIERMISRGMKRLENLTGTTLDFNDLNVKDLLINWCRYDRNLVSEHFLENFQDEILHLQLKEGIKAGDDIETT